MKTIYKIYLAKYISKILRLLFNEKVLVKRGEINWQLNLNEGIDLSIFLFGKFESSIAEVAKYLINKKKMDILDIGSNIGVHSLKLAKIFEKSKIFSIEPTDYAFKKLNKNVRLNKQIKNIKIFQYFISNKKIAPKKVYSSWELNKKHKKHKKHLGTLKKTQFSKIITLDKFVKENKINNKIFIKCDVDGNELDVFKSGKNFFKKHKPYVIMELAPYLYPEYGYDVDKLLKLLIQYNYRFYDAKNYLEIKDIFEYAKNISDGSSVNIFLK